MQAYRLYSKIRLSLKSAYPDPKLQLSAYLQNPPRRILENNLN